MPGTNRPVEDRRPRLSVFSRRQGTGEAPILHWMPALNIRHQNRMHWQSLDSYESLSSAAARIFIDAIRNDPRIVLGLPTGRTPVGMYERVVNECSCRDIVTFNLDEYAGISCDRSEDHTSELQSH